MRSVSPATGVRSASASQHVGSRQHPASLHQPAAGRARPQSAQPARGSSSNSTAARPRPASSLAAPPVSADASREIAFLYQQLRTALQQQATVEEQRQLHLVQFRRRLRTICDDNAALRSIIQAGEARKRDAEVATAVGPEAMSGARVHTAGTTRGPPTVTEAETEVLNHRIHLARMRHNKAVHDIQANEVALATEAAAQSALIEQATATLDPAALLVGANRPVYLRMRRLEQMLNEVLRKQRVVGVILANYRHHLDILNSEATQYDAHQALLEEAFADRHRDHLQLLQLHETARAAYATAVEARQTVSQSAARMRQAKEVALRRKRREVDSNLAVTQQQERRAVDLQQQLEEEGQLLEAAENNRTQLQRQRMNSRAALTLLQETSPSRDDGPGKGGEQTSTGVDERVAAYEVAFRDMMRIAKVKTIDELVTAYQVEIEHQCRLQDELETLRDEQAVLKDKVEALRERAKQVKYCVGAGTHHAAEQHVNDTTVSPLLERELTVFVEEERAALSSHVEANEGSHSLLREVAERVNRLAELVADYRADVRVPPIQQTAALAQRSSTLPLHAAVLTQKLLALAAEVGAAAADGSGGVGGDLSDGHDASGRASRETATQHRPHPPQAQRAGSVPVIAATPLVIPAHNRRVSLGGRRKGPGGAAASAADVAGMSWTAARALLITQGGVAAGGGAQLRRRRSSAAAGAGFIEGQEDEDAVHLTTVAALPPQGGRVLDFDGADSSVASSAVHSSTGAHGAGGSGDGPDGAAGARGRRRSSGRLARGAAAGAAWSPPSPTSQQQQQQSGAASRGRGAGGGGGGGGGDDQEDPLRREEVKRMSTLMQARRAREEEKNARPL